MQCWIWAVSHGIELMNGRGKEVVPKRGSTSRPLQLTESSVTTPAIAMETETTVTADHLGQADLHHLEILKTPTDLKRYLLNKGSLVCLSLFHLFFYGIFWSF